MIPSLKKSTKLFVEAVVSKLEQEAQTGKSTRNVKDNL